MFSSRGLTAIAAFITGWALLFWGAGIGSVLFGKPAWGLLIGIAVGIILSIVGVVNADRILLKVTRAKPLNSSKYHNVIEWVNAIHKQLRMARPKIFIIQEMLPNFCMFGSSPEKLTFVFTSAFLDLGRPEFIKAALALGMVSADQGALQERTLGSTLAYLFMFPAKIADFISRGSGSRYNLLSLLLLIPFAPIAAIIVHLTSGKKDEIYTIDMKAGTVTGDQGYIGVTYIELNKTLTSFTVDTDLALVPLFITSPICTNPYFKIFRPYPPLSKRINRLAKKRELLRKEEEERIEAKLKSGKK